MKRPIQPFAALIVVSCLLGCSEKTYPEFPKYVPPPPYPPMPTEPTVTPPPPISVSPPRGANPCYDDLESLPAPNAGDTPWETGRTAANTFDAAGQYREDFWVNGTSSSGIAALQLYHQYRLLSPPSDPLVPHAVLHSISIYCKMGCEQKAQSLAGELQGSRGSDVAKALSYCKGQP
jgi:hypothetical protein